MRRIPLSRRSHITGFQPSPAGLADHESALERDFVTRVRFDDPAVVISSQPVTISFQDGAKRRRYTPDFLLHRSIELIEVKYEADLRENEPRLAPAFAAARAWAQERGGTFRVVTETEIRGARLDNARRLLPLRDVPLDVGVAAAALSAARGLASPTLGSVLALLQVERPLALATMWRLIARGALRVDLTVKITVDTAILAT